jgi:hypothetical protein
VRATTDLPSKLAKHATKMTISIGRTLLIPGLRIVACYPGSPAAAKPLHRVRLVDSTLKAAAELLAASEK